MRSFKQLSALVLAAASALGASQAVHAEDLLTIGSAAPQLNVEHWVQNGNGKFKPVSKFENGKVYVLNSGRLGADLVFKACRIWLSCRRSTRTKVCS